MALISQERTSISLRPKKLIASARQYARRQRAMVLHRLVNPARYCIDLAKINTNAVIKNTLVQPIRVVIISDLADYCTEEQLTPFASYRISLRAELQLIAVHLILKDALRAPKLILSPFDIIILKMSYRTPSDEALRVARIIREAAKHKRILYFDGDDDLGVQWPQILPDIDLYVKKHAMRDRAGYLKRFVGKSHLHDYVYHKYGHSYSARDYGGSTMIEESGPVPAEQLSKIQVGCNIALDRNIAKLCKDLQRRLPVGPKENDIIFRGTVAQDWSSYLRQDIEPKLRLLETQYRIIIPNKRVSYEEYVQEMLSTKICVSPFGYGEICWRDFEAVLCKCLLIKPDMSHVETYPDIFRPYETYVPVKWDFSDLREKCIYYLTHDSDRERIVAQAFKVLNEFYKDDGFIKSVSKMLRRLGY